MNDFSEIENDLRKLRPRSPSSQLIERVEAGIGAADAERKIIRPDRFRINWFAVGLGLAAAAVLLIFARLQLEQTTRPAAVARQTPAPAAGSSAAPAQFLPAAATEVVYNTRDEGLLFPGSSTEPVRRIRSHRRETFRWRNPATGASLQVSYPTEQVELRPVAGQ